MTNGGGVGGVAARCLITSGGGGGGGVSEWLGLSGYAEWISVLVDSIRGRIWLTIIIDESMVICTMVHAVWTCSVYHVFIDI